MLGYANPAKAVIDHCKGVSKLETPTNGGVQAVKYITEGDVYRLVVKAADQSRSKSVKEKASRFESWVFDEIMPSIRKTGGYMVVKDEETPEETMARALLIAKDALDRKEERIKALEVEGRAKDERIARMSPMAAFAENVLDSDGSCTVTEAARLMKQVDPSMGQRKLFGLLRAEWRRPWRLNGGICTTSSQSRTRTRSRARGRCARRTRGSPRRACAG